MPTRPTTPAAWATNTTYPAGGLDWSGQNCKVQPSAGKQAQGITPNTDQPAEEFNWLWNLYALWIQWFDFLLFSVLNVTPPTTSADAPQMIIKDSAGNNRAIFDHNGFPMGRRSEFREEWTNLIGTVSATATPIVPLQRWSTTIAGASNSLTISPPSAAYPANFPFLSTPGGAVSAFAYTAAPLIHTGNTFLSTVVEWEAGTSNTTVGSHSEVLYMGLTDNPAAPGSSNNYCWFRMPLGAGQLDWFCETANGGTATSVDSTNGAFNAAFPGTRFRIELHGTASPYAGKARFFVNDVLVQTITTNLPASAALSFMFGASSAASGLALNIKIGPLLATWPRFLSLPAL